MSAYTSGVANSICASASITVSATDVSDGSIEVDFQIDEVLDYVIQVVTDADIFVPLVDAVITKPSNGVVNLANGGATFALVEDQVVTILAVRRLV